MKCVKKHRPGILAMAALVLAVVLMGCAGPEPLQPAQTELLRPAETELLTSAKLTMTVDRVEGDRFYITFRNDTDEIYEFGWGCALDKKVDGVWYELKRSEDVAFTAEAYVILPDSELAWEEGVSYYGSLDTGEYRLLKSMIGPGEPGDSGRIFTIGADFNID